MTSNVGVVAEHYNNLKECGIMRRYESRIFHLRNFNNWVKSNLINNISTNVSRQYNKFDVLDLGSGKGGDQIKFAHAGASHVTFLDIAEISVEDSKDRYRKGRYVYSADFFVHDFTKGFVDLLSHRKYHLVSCQFAFHYAFESHLQAYNMITSISESLHPGGYFVGTTINALELAKRLKTSSGNSFGNDLYKVSFDNEDKEKLQLFGEKYHFYLEGSVNCPEYMVYPPLLDKICVENGLQLFKRCSLPEFYQANIETSHGRALLSRIKALQEMDMDQLNKAPVEEFAEAKKYYDPAKYYKISTISKSEWEIIELYDVFVYQKI